MLLASHLNKSSVFAADRRSDISVQLNDPILEALGPEAEAIADYLSKAGAAVLELYPELSISFSIGRLIADSEGFIRQFVKLNTIAPLVEIRLFDFMHSATNWLRSFDELAFVTAYVTHKPENNAPFIRRKRNKQLWWRCDE